MKNDLNLTYEKTIYGKIELLIQHFHAVSDKLEDEEDVKSSIIDKFIDILDWDLGDPLEAKKEQKTEDRKRADYALKVDGKPKIYIEAKSLDKDLEKGFDKTSGEGKRTYVEQTINYAYNSGVNWALLTNGKRWMLFNAYWKGTHKDRIAFDLEIDDFLKGKNFDKIKLLAKEYVVTGKLDEYFKDRPFRNPVDEEVVAFLLGCRRALTESVIKNNEGKYTTDQLREGIHRILDRLAFYKICEDRDILDYGRIKKTFDIFREDKSSQSFVIGLKSYYDWFNKIYDGEMFGPHFCEDFIVDNSVYKMLVDGLYQYDFATIDVDVLGRIYENYLGNTLQELEKGLKWAIDSKERKRFGQYYTPQYVVDYIIDNVGITRDSKILDPACGSGAFLIKAYDRLKLLNQEHIKRIVQKKKHNLSEADFKKWEKEELPKIEKEFINQILSRNIHGVDLNPESVELTKVNLWLRSIQKDIPLNKLENNIECGNSLISGTEEELKQYFGDDLEEKRPFNWEEEFKDIFNKGGFDMVVGNPPYVRIHKIPNEDKTYFKDQYKSAIGQFDLYVLFLEQGIKLLRDGGILGLITQNTFLSLSTYEDLRKLILDNCEILQIVNFGDHVFDEATVATTIVLLRKQIDANKRKSNKVKVITKIKNLAGEYEEGTIQQDLFTKFPKYAFNIYSPTEVIGLLSRIEKNTVRISDICSVNRGIEIGKSSIFVTIEKPLEDFRKVVSGEDVRKYKLSGHKFIVYRPSKIDYKDESVYLQEKIIARDIRSRFATYDNEHHYTLKTAYNIILKDKSYSLKYILAIYNSKLMTFYHRKRFAKEDITLPRTYIFEIEQLPIKPASPEVQQQFVVLVDKMLSLNKELPTINTNFFDYVNLHPKLRDTNFGLYFNQLDMNDKKVLNNSNGIKGKIKKIKAREESGWLVVSVDYGDVNKELVGDFDVLKCRFENLNLTKFIKHCILNYGKSIGKGNILDRVLKIENIPIFDNKSDGKNQQVIDEIMDSFLLAAEWKERIEKEIEDTDRTIDQMVYDLYGLSEAEIKIIEEASA